MSVLFNHTAIQARLLSVEILDQVKKVIASGIFLEGSQNTLLIKNLQKYFNAKYVVPLASGHDALVYALQALHLSPNDEVIIPANAYPTACAAYQAGARIVLADVNRDAQISLQEIQKKVTPHTKAVIVVHLYGFVGQLKEITSWLDKQKIVCIEDCAQSFGTTVEGIPVGTFGRFGCFSFYPTKNLGTLGDGGAIVTKRKKDYEFILQAKAYGEKKKYYSQFVSGHSRLPEIQASVLNLYLKHFPKTQKSRQKIWKYFIRQIQLHHLHPFITPMQASREVQPTPHLCVLQVKDRDQLQAYLKKHGIETHIHYPVPIHKVPAFASLSNQDTSFPVTEYLSNTILSVPFHQFLREENVDEIIQLIQQFYLQNLPKNISLTLMFPAYNDAQSIPALVEKANEVGSFITEDYEVLVVNDGSSDDTQKVLQRLQRKYPALRVIHHQQNKGYGGALRTGFTSARKEWFFYTDGDGQYDPYEAVLLLKELRLHPKADLINGYKKNREDTFTRRLAGNVYNAVLHWIYPLAIRDVDCDFRLIRTKKLQSLTLSSNSGLICVELISQLTRSGAKCFEVGVSHFPRQFGHSQFFAPTHLWHTLVEHLHYATKYPLVK